MIDINKYAANINNSPATYGSIDLGLKVVAFRKQRKHHYQSKGYTWRQAEIAAHKDVIGRFGLPIK